MIKQSASIACKHSFKCDVLHDDLGWGVTGRRGKIPLLHGQSPSWDDEPFREKVFLKY